jgi:hypothetical protein
MPEFAVGRLGRLFETSAINIKQPTMIEAAQTAILNATHTEISAAVRTVQPQ